MAVGLELSHGAMVLPHFSEGCAPCQPGALANEMGLVGLLVRTNHFFITLNGGGVESSFR